MNMSQKQITDASKLDEATLLKTGYVKIIPSVASLDNAGYIHSSYHAMLFALLKIEYAGDIEYNVKPEDAVEVIPVLPENGGVREVHSADDYKIWLKKTGKQADEIVKRYID